MSEKKIENYLKNYPSAKRFHDQMVIYRDEYTEYLLLVKSSGTGISEGTIVHEFINYLFGHHLITDINEITVAMANSKFYANYTFHNKEKISRDTVKKILKDFFTFLYGKHGIKNEKIMRGFNKKNKVEHALH